VNEKLYSEPVKDPETTLKNSFRSLSKMIRSERNVKWRQKMV